MRYHLYADDTQQFEVLEFYIKTTKDHENNVVGSMEKCVTEIKIQMIVILMLNFGVSDCNKIVHALVTPRLNYVNALMYGLPATYCTGYIL